jgi:hypothetical protein
LCAREQPETGHAYEDVNGAEAFFGAPRETNGGAGKTKRVHDRKERAVAEAGVYGTRKQRGFVTSEEAMRRWRMMDGVEQADVNGMACACRFHTEEPLRDGAEAV